MSSNLERGKAAVPPLLQASVVEMDAALSTARQLLASVEVSLAELDITRPPSKAEPVRRNAAGKTVEKVAISNDRLNGLWTALLALISCISDISVT